MVSRCCLGGVAPCAAAVLAPAFSLLALAALVLAPARFVGAGFFSCCGGAVVCCCAAAAAKIWPPKWPRTPHNPILARTSTLRRGTRFLGLFLKCYVRPKIAVQVFPVFWGGWVDRAPRERAQKFRESQKTGPRDHPYQGLTAYRTFLPYPTQEGSCFSLKWPKSVKLGLLQPSRSVGVRLE